ncbi:hypothetical protein [Ulvibacter litoralis]|uniref:Phenylalanyl-tRNA synthetase subunit alpha n=1 Tax=Ulvibacter litoralis TaxID=227084 RepID=A0A1G7DH60_9FLAO|nr:hypothetical protein [Ulvibacter litoralis]GHC43449.1 hypothetical protein GCM10008083_02280 [Ulvibacter litoralis]SDE50904.1 hypothetical protein SAMN05421855_101982 [Ulvibacter litoralis]
MRKDIEIPEVKDVYVAAVLDFNEDHKTNDWNAYIINDSAEAIETVLIITQGYDDKDMTAPLRHTIKMVPAKGYARIEYLENSVLRLNNFFTITYFQGTKMYDKRFELPANSVLKDNTVQLPVMTKEGVLAR